MVSLGLAGVVVLQNWGVYSFVISGILRSFVHIDPPIFSSFSNNTVRSVAQTCYSTPDVLLMGYHDVPLSGVTVTPDLLGRTSFLANTAVILFPNILLR